MPDQRAGRRRNRYGTAEEAVIAAIEGIDCFPGGDTILSLTDATDVQVVAQRAIEALRSEGWARV